jgi:hypothetical protein
MRNAIIIALTLLLLTPSCRKLSPAEQAAEDARRQQFWTCKVEANEAEKVYEDQCKTRTTGTVTDNQGNIYTYSSSTSCDMPQAMYWDVYDQCMIAAGYDPG